MKSLIFIFLASSSFALLPPLAQSSREIKAILADPQIYQLLGSAQLIQQVARNEMGYLILTQDYSLQVDLHYLPTDIVGPARFQLVFNPPKNRAWEP